MGGGELVVFEAGDWRGAEKVGRSRPKGVDWYTSDEESCVFVLQHGLLLQVIREKLVVRVAMREIATRNSRKIVFSCSNTVYCYI